MVVVVMVTTTLARFSSKTSNTDNRTTWANICIASQHWPVLAWALQACTGPSATATIERPRHQRVSLMTYANTLVVPRHTGTPIIGPNWPVGECSIPRDDEWPHCRAPLSPVEVSLPWRRPLPSDDNSAHSKSALRNGTVAVAVTGPRRLAPLPQW